jgi:CRP/FNR family transcriptional regulator
MGVRGERWQIDDDIRRAIESSFLRRLEDDAVQALFRGATRRRVPAGSTFRGESEAGAHLELLVSGFVRAYVAAPDGRSLTIRYLRPGSLMGVVSLFTPRYTMPGSIQALVDADLVVLRPAAVQRLAAEDVSVAAALLDELAERVLSFVAEIPGSAFATVRQRVARHLLDLASERQHGSVLVARISQQQLAEAVGSVREVVVRALRDLRTDGIVETGSGGIRVIDPERLYGEIYGALPARRWNLGH